MKILLSETINYKRKVVLHTFQNIAYHLGSKYQFGHFWREGAPPSCMSLSRTGPIKFLLINSYLFQKIGGDSENPETNCCRKPKLPDFPYLFINFGLWCTIFNPLMPSGSFNICCPRDCVSRHNGGTSLCPP